MKKTVGKTIAVLGMAGVMVTGLFAESANAAFLKDGFSTTAGVGCEIRLSTGTIGVHRYALTSIVKTVDIDKNFSSAYVEAELEVIGDENPFDYNEDDDVSVISVTVTNPSGTTSNGKGYSACNVSDEKGGYGGIRRSIE